MSRRFVVNTGGTRSFMPPSAEGTPNTKVLAEDELADYFGEQLPDHVLDRFAMAAPEPAPKKRGRPKKVDVDAEAPRDPVDPFAS